jgi:cellulose synthase/poly-beta-1,6-N-acetylglucosamine synthase-like glycosyltransferase
MDNYVRPHEYTVVFDGDNLAHPDFLLVINQYANAGYRSIQGQRTAKNLDTTYAAMDALGEFYKNYIERYVTYLLGSSSVISGSGMAVQSDLYKAYLESPEIEQGKHQWKKMLQEDKILQNFLLRQNERIVYAREAICYDEKVDSGDAIETQRSRWLFSYFQNLPNSSRLLLKGIFNFNFNQFLFGLVTVAPPLFILVGLAGIFMILGIFIHLPTGIALFSGLIIFSLTVLWSLKLSDAPKQIWEAVWSLPFFILKQFKGLLKMGNPNKNFKHTEHTKNVSVDEVLSKNL